MRYRVGIENNVEGRSLAWALEHPGCFSYGRNGDEAFSALTSAIQEYAEWLDNRYKDKCWLRTEEIELQLDGVWDGYSIDEQYELTDQGYEVNAWFRFDWKPLTEEDVFRATQLLLFSRDDLLSVSKSLNQAELETQFTDERWSIEGILKHIVRAELWYMDRLGLITSHLEMPPDIFEYLEVGRQFLMEILPSLIGSTRVVGVDGEFWSSRKLLRRAVWHERDHTFHIQRLRSLLEAGV